MNISTCTPTMLAVAVWSVAAASAAAGEMICATPFIEMCSHTTRTQWLADQDIVVLAKLTKVLPPCRGCQEERGSFEIVEVLKGADVPAVRIGGRLDNLWIRGGKLGDVYLLYSTAPPKWHWWNFGRLTVDEQQYYLQLQKLPTGPQRLAFFFEHLEESGLRGCDARDEFHCASYRQLRELKPYLPRAKVVERLKSPKLPGPRRGLYEVLLGICGAAEDAAWFEAELQRVPPQQWWREASLLTGYLSLQGEKGLSLAVDSYLNHPDDGGKVTAGFLALRFIAAQTDVIPRARLATAFKSLRNRKGLYGHELIGLAHCQDWSELRRAWERFEQADAENELALRASIIQYMRMCPLDAARPLRQECEELDPRAADQADMRWEPISGRNSSMPVWEQEFVQ